MKVFAVYTHDYTGEAGMMVFSSLEAAKRGIREDIENVVAILREDKYEAKCTGEQDGDYFEIYVPDTDIYYEWSLFDTELRD